MRTTNLLALAALFGSMVGSHALAVEVLEEITWTGLRDAGRLGAGSVLDAGSGGSSVGSIEIRAAAQQPGPQTLFSIENPKITATSYGIVGRVRCDGIEGTAYVEMWSHFPGGGAFFSRTLADSGPMAALTGTAGWRPFLLPFFNSKGNPPPERLVINAYIPARGSLYLSTLRLVQFTSGEDPLSGIDGAREWWTSRQAGTVGGACGATIGIIGALIGWLVSRGRARKVVLGLMIALIVLGVLQLAAGAVSLMCSQPYHVWFPLFLGGTLEVGIFGPLLLAARKRYQDLELRRIRALDAR